MNPRRITVYAAGHPSCTARMKLGRMHYIAMMAVLILSGCATTTPEQQAASAALLQQYSFNQQLAQQRYYQDSMASLYQNQANWQAQQNMINQTRVQGQLDYIQRGVARQERQSVQNSILHPGRGW